MRDLAVPLFLVTIFMTPVVFGLVALLFRALSSREPGIYEQLGSPSLIKDRDMALAKLGRFLCSRLPEQLNDRVAYALANTLRVLMPLYVFTAVPFVYFLFFGSRAA